MLWKCPNCSATLITQLNCFVCEAGHSFDFAKQGYVNLLLDNQRNSKKPGDNEAMIDARRRFLGAGYYDAVIESLIPFLKNSASVLDLGCGEGYYLAQLIKQMPESTTGYGIDISKNAVKKAATNRSLVFAVASTFNIPIMADSINTAISIFAPFCPVEVKRVLVNDGQLIRVSPGKNHLAEIKAKLYQTAKNHTQPETPIGFTQQFCQGLSWTAMLSGSTLMEDLIPMTPLHWHGSPVAKSALVGLDMNVTFDFYIEVFKKNV